jgi:hypothetical protein
VQRAVDDGSRVCERHVRFDCDAGVARASYQERLHQLREPIRFQINLRKEVIPCLFVPFDVRPEQTGDESLDMTQREPKVMRDGCAVLLL